VNGNTLVATTRVNLWLSFQTGSNRSLAARTCLLVSPFKSLGIVFRRRTSVGTYQGTMCVMRGQKRIEVSGVDVTSARKPGRRLVLPEPQWADCRDMPPNQWLSETLV
jgi:hypothetical protein